MSCISFAADTIIDHILKTIKDKKKLSLLCVSARLDIKMELLNECWKNEKDTEEDDGWPPKFIPYYLKTLDLLLAYISEKKFDPKLQERYCHRIELAKEEIKNIENGEKIKDFIRQSLNLSIEKLSTPMKVGDSLESMESKFFDINEIPMLDFKNKDEKKLFQLKPLEHKDKTAKHNLLPILEPDLYESFEFDLPINSRALLEHLYK